MTAFVGIARFQRTIFVGYRDSFSVQNPVWLMPQARRICGRGLSLRMVLPTVKGVASNSNRLCEIRKAGGAVHPNGGLPAGLGSYGQ